MIDNGTVTDGGQLLTNINSSGIPIDMESLTKTLVSRDYTTKRLVQSFGSSIEAKDFKHMHRERRPIRTFTTITTAQAAGAATITVDDYTGIKNDVVLWVVRDGVKIMQLISTAVASAAAVAIVNFTGSAGSGTLPAATEVGDVVVIGNEAHAEGEAPPAAFSNISVDVYDYCMEVIRTVKKSNREGAVNHYDPSEKSLVADMTMAWFEEEKKQSLGMWLGTQTKEIVSASGPTRYQVKGFLDRLTENQADYSDVGDGYTQQAFQEDLRKCVDSSPLGSEKFLLAGVAINNAISSWPEGSIRTDPRAKDWGVMINLIRTQYGEVAVAYEPLLSAKHGMASLGAVLEKKNMRMMHVQGLPMKAFVAIQNNRDITNMENAIAGTWGITTDFAETMFLVKGVS